MKRDNFYINDFVDKLCRARYDKNGTDCAQESLETLKFVLHPQDFQEVSEFNQIIRSFEHIATEEDVDITDPKNVAAAQKYENFVEKSAISPENKAALYNTLLGFISFNGGSNQWYMNILHKKAVAMPHGKDYELNLTAQQAFFHRRGTSRSVYLNALHRLYTKMDNKTKFTFLKELGLTLDKDGKKLISASKMTPQQRLERLSVIQSVIKQPLSAEMRIPLLEEGLNLANNNLRHRSDNFEIKRNFSKQLHADYTFLGQYAKANQYALEASKWDRSLILALEYGRDKQGR